MNNHIISVKTSVKVPMPPNYILHAEMENHKFDVADLSDEDLQAIGEAWTKQLIEHARKRRKEKP
jgi:hypothetical protein